MNNFWQSALEKLENGYSIVLLAVAKAQGSTPGRQGFKMLISEDNSQYGTIGGGIMELNFIKLAQELLRNKKSSGFTLKVQIHHKYAPEEQQSGLICSGEEWIVYGSLEPNKNNIALCHKIINETDSRLQLIIEPETIHVTLIDELKNDGEQYTFDMKSESEWLFTENLAFKNHLYIFGGGHVGLALSRVFSILENFIVTVIDSRPDVDTIKNNKYANEIIIDEYKNAGNYIKEGNTSYVAVVTTSMPTDVQVLSSCLHKNVRYLGLMGSKSKKKEVFAQLRKKGFTEEDINRIKCPIGIEDIKTHSAGEIAISIAAEVLKVMRN